MSYFELLHKKYNKITLTIDEVTDELGMSKRTLERMLKDDLFPVAILPGKSKRLFLLKSFAEYLEALEEMAEAA